MTSNMDVDLSEGYLINLILHSPSTVPVAPISLEMNVGNVILGREQHTPRVVLHQLALQHEEVGLYLNSQ